MDITYPRTRTALIPQAYDVAFTAWRADFRYQFGFARADGQPIKRNGPVRSNPIPFALVANAPAICVAIGNDARTGLIIKNLDPTTDLLVGFGVVADAATGFPISPLQTLLLDFVTPTDAIWAFSTANVRGYLIEMAPTVGVQE